jgi:hypothetical protein
MEINAINIIKNPENHTSDVFHEFFGVFAVNNPELARAFFAVLAGRATMLLSF